MDHFPFLRVNSKIVTITVLQQEVTGKTVIDHDLLSLILTGSPRIVYFDTVDQLI